MSLVFFFLFIGLAMASVVPTKGSDFLMLVLPSVLAIISFSGSVFCIREIKKESKLWYFGLPHCIALFILIFSNPLDIIRGKHNLDFFILVMGILSITSVSFFLSFSGSYKKITRWFALLSGVIGIYAVFLIYYIIQDALTPFRWDSILVFLEGLYLLVLMPIIGLCYIATALIPSDDRNRSML
jgi:hypothetical protein